MVRRRPVLPPFIPPIPPSTKQSPRKFPSLPSPTANLVCRPRRLNDHRTFANTILTVTNDWTMGITWHNGMMTVFTLSCRRPVIPPVIHPVLSVPMPCPVPSGPSPIGSPTIGVRTTSVSPFVFIVCKLIKIYPTHEQICLPARRSAFGFRHLGGAVAAGNLPLTGPYQGNAHGTKAA